MADLQDFFRTLRSASSRVLFLDYDGTLAPFRVVRDQAVPYRGVTGALSRLRDQGGTRLVVVSGRPVREVLPLLGLEPAPEAWGGHGWERQRPGGELEVLAVPPAALRTLASEWNWLVQCGLAVRSERKAASLAVHWRGLPPLEAAEIQTTIEGRWRPLAAAANLELREFAAGRELRVPGRDKGVVVREVLAEVGCPCVAAYLGDDETDEDAFRAIAGHGLGVLVREQRRPTAATHWLRPPGELLAFLARWAEATREDQDPA